MCVRLPLRPCLGRHAGERVPPWPPPAAAGPDAQVGAARRRGEGCHRRALLPRPIFFRFSRISCPLSPLPCSPSRRRLLPTLPPPPSIPHAALPCEPPRPRHRCPGAQGPPSSLSRTSDRFSLSQASCHHPCRSPAPSAAPPTEADRARRRACRRPPPAPGAAWPARRLAGVSHVGRGGFGFQLSFLFLASCPCLRRLPLFACPRRACAAQHALSHRAPTSQGASPSPARPARPLVTL